MRFLLDTSVISEVGKPRPNPKVLNWLLANEAARAVPSIAAFVIEAGDRVVTFDAAAAAAWGEYVTKPAMKQPARSHPDTQIAAIALSRKLTVVTRNIADFPEVTTLNPFEA